MNTSFQSEMGHKILTEKEIEKKAFIKKEKEIKREEKKILNIYI